MLLVGVKQPDLEDREEQHVLMLSLDMALIKGGPR